MLPLGWLVVHQNSSINSHLVEQHGALNGHKETTDDSTTWTVFIYCAVFFFFTSLDLVKFKSVV